MKQFQSIILSFGTTQAAEEGINSLVKTFYKNELRRKQYTHLQNWINKELENPTPVENHTIEEKIASLKEQKVKVDKALEEFDLLVKSSMKGLKIKCDRVNPYLYHYAHAKFLALDMMGEFKYQ